MHEFFTNLRKVRPFVFLPGIAYGADEESVSGNFQNLIVMD